MIVSSFSQLLMRSRPNKLITRTKSPLLLISSPSIPAESRPADRHPSTSRNEIVRMGSADVKLRMVSPEAAKEVKKGQQRTGTAKDVKKGSKEAGVKVQKIEGMGMSVKDQDDDTTEQSSSQHLSYVTGEYQLDNYDIFSRRKNVKFQEKIEDLQKTDKKRGSSNSSRNSSILKNSSRMLDQSLLSNDKSVSIQNSFSAKKQCKIGLTINQDNGNALIRKRYESTLSSLKNSRQKNQKYIDELFPPVQASIFSTSVHRKGHISRTKDQIVWMRLSQIFPKATKVFSSAKINANIWKGDKSYAENYLVASFNAIKNRPTILGSIFQQSEASPYGIYLMKIYQQSTWKYIIVDDLIPCTRKRGKGKLQDIYTPLFLNVSVSEAESLQLWPYLLEKAYASYYSSYENLCFGNPIDFLSELTGSPYKEIHIVNKKVSKQILNQNLASVEHSFANENVVGLGWSEDKDCFYPISVLRDVYTGEGIQLGLGDPNNKYQSIKVEMRQLPNALSTVFIFSFKEYVNTVTCPVYPPKVIKPRPKKPQKQRTRHIEIPPNDTTSLRAFTLFKKTKCTLNVRQKQNRFYWQCGITEYVWTRCLLLQKEYDGGYRWVNGKYCNQKHIIFEENLDAGEYLLVVMVEWREKHNKELTVFLYSDQDFIKFQRKNYVREDRIIELASMDHAQRNGRLNQINKSICAYTFLCEQTGLVIENIVNQRSKGEVTIMRSINGLKSRVEILPINQDFQVDGPQQYGALDKNEGRKVIGQTVEIDIQRGESFTVVLRMRGGLDRKFFKVFNFG